jgi:hypothetical protein
MRTAGAICLLVAVTAPTLVVIQGTPSFATEPAVSQAAAPQAPPSEATPAMESWRRQMVRTPFPKPGCYTSGYPETEWQEVPCSTAEARPHPTNGDYSAQVTSGSISSATGSFGSVTGANGETDSQAGANQFSLQLNTNPFDSPLCDKGNSGCGWQQYIYDSPGNVYIQYWLINNKQPCPSKSWKYQVAVPNGAPGCYINGNQVTPSTAQAITDLAKLRLIGSSSSSQQSAMLQDADGKLWGSPDSGDLLSIGTQWTAAEFNVVGAGNASTANLTPSTGTTVVVETSVDNRTTNPPGYGGGFTGESNNLTLKAPPCPIGGASPAIVFTESNAPGATSACALAANPSSLSVIAGDGSNGGSNEASTDVVASGFWASDANSAPTLSFSGVPQGVTAAITNDINPPTVTFTAGVATAVGTHPITITGNIGGITGTAVVALNVGACQPLSCAAARWTCGSFDNGCGAPSQCGTCGAGLTCTGGSCFKCPIENCPAPKYWSVATCSCVSCPCGFGFVNGRRICAVCKL